jgi:hypothetical protein
VSTTVNSIYLDISNVLWENGGLTLGLIQPADVLRFIGESTTDFLAKSGICKKIVCLNVQAGINSYTVPDQVSDLQYANYDQTYMHHTSTFYLDNTWPRWASATGVPEEWNQDEIGTKQVKLNPTPNYSGNQVDTTNVPGFYGVLSNVSNANDINITGPSTGLYGVINGFSGAPYLEAINPAYGVISSMCCSPTNLELIATALPSTLNPTLAGYLEIIPDSLAPAIKYQVLARIFAQDGEMKDMQKSYFCQALAGEYFSLCAAIMTEEFQEDPPGGKRNG